MMDKNFSPDFYVTCATVIPVLFLAVSVQGRVSEFVERGWLAMQRQPYASQPWMRWLKLMAPPMFWTGLVYIVISAGFIGEVGALSALYRGSEEPGQRMTVFTATLILVPIVAVGPVHSWRPRAVKQGTDELEHDEPGQASDADTPPETSGGT